MNLFEELKRRNVFRVGAAYAVVGWLIAQVADTFFARLGLPDWTVTFVMVLVVIGLPIALLLAWAFEMTPEGVRKTADVDKGESVTASTGQKLNFVIIGALVLALAFIAWDKLGNGPAPSGIEVPTEPIIAVLPFVNMSSDPEQEYFSDGISEEILNVLARTQGLKVVARTSSFQYKGQSQDITAIADALGANIVLEGSVRRGGDQVRITAQLIDAATGLHLWSDTYDRELIDIFAVQDEISENIATALLGTIGINALPENRFAGTRNIAVYNMYLRATSFLAARGTDNLNEANRLFELVVEQDTDFADAWAGLAKARLLLKINLGTPVETAAIQEAADQALALDPENGRALAAIGLAELDRMNFREGLDILARAVRAAPNDADARYWYAIAQGFFLDFKEASDTIFEALELDPANPAIFRSAIESAVRAKDDDRALALLERFENGETPVDPNSEGFGPDVRFRLLAFMGRFEDAELEFRRVYPGDEEASLNGHFYLFAVRSGDPDRIARAHATLDSLGQDGPQNLQILRFIFGEPAPARTALLRLLEGSNSRMEWNNSIRDAVARPDSMIVDPLPLYATIPEYVEAYARAGIPVFEGVEPLEIEGIAK